MEIDLTRYVLIKYVQETEMVLEKTLKLLDSNATCSITPSLDIGFPHDVIRIAGGFPTGVFVKWNSNVPFTPVDTTVNICTGSMYKLSKNYADSITEKSFIKMMEQLDGTSYNINFHRGNHFISIATDEKIGQDYLFIHTSAAEFKDQFNGLYPIVGNWFMNHVKTNRVKNRYIRYLSGKKAELFAKMAHQLIEYNEIRHDFFADTLLENSDHIESSEHFHHYCMPTHQSILIGSFLVEPNKTVPIFTRPGKPIILFKVQDSKHVRYTIDGQDFLLIPHGWGKRCLKIPNLEIDFDNKSFSLNDIKFKLDGKSSLRAHPDLDLRDYEFKTGIGYEVFEKELLEFCNGEVVNYLSQKISYNKLGFKRW